MKKHLDRFDHFFYENMNQFIFLFYKNVRPCKRETFFSLKTMKFRFSLRYQINTTFLIDLFQFQDESEEDYSSEVSDEDYEEELGSDESSGKDW